MALERNCCLVGDSVEVFLAPANQHFNGHLTATLSRIPLIDPFKRSWWGLGCYGVGVGIESGSGLELFSRNKCEDEELLFH